MFNLSINVVSVVKFGFITLSYDDFKLETDYVKAEPSITISNKGINIQPPAFGLKAPIKGIG